MRAILVLAFFWASCAAEVRAEQASVRIKKVLVHLLDHDGKHFLSPSLYERDAYQAHLRQTPLEQGGLRFDIQCVVPKARAVTVQVEMRGANLKKATQDRLSRLLLVRGDGGTRWTALSTDGENFRQFGQLTAWRVTLWDGDQLLTEQRSFLW